VVVAKNVHDELGPTLKKHVEIRFARSVAKSYDAEGRKASTGRERCWGRQSVAVDAGLQLEEGVAPAESPPHVTDSVTYIRRSSLEYM
jgi:hypothetical protein